MTRAGEDWDVAIVGAGPAGLALAAETSSRGQATVLIDPAVDHPWVPTWSGFEDELPGVPIARRWSVTRTVLDEREICRERAYVKVDKVELQRVLTERTAAVARVRLAVTGSDANGVRLSDDTVLRARHVVDCSGTAQVLSPDNPAPACFQTAFGLEVVTRGHPWDLDTATWMDLTDLSDPPTFLYAMPVDARRVFVEETALAARPAVSLDLLQSRLMTRLDALGIEIVDVLETERCRIALDVAPPTGLAFGAAAAMIHPASGYQLARSLAAAPGFAEHLAANDPARAMASISRGWVHRLHRLGLETLVRSDGRGTKSFFDTYFAQPHWVQDAFMGTESSLPATIGAMSRIFTTAPGGVRRRLAAPLFSRRPPEVSCSVP